MKVELVDSMGSDLSVVNAARVSFGKRKTALDDADRKLIAYLAKHGHWSPFAHTSLSFRVSAPIFIARQLAKHQIGGAWNEESRRYIDSEIEIYTPETWRVRADDVKQGSGRALVSPGDHELMVAAKDSYREAIEEAHVTYNHLLALGIAPEQARMVLPVASYTNWIWTGSLLFFSRVCNLRMEDHAQLETMEVAQMIHDICEELFPVSWRALMAD